MEDEQSPDSEAHDLALSLRAIMPGPVSRKVCKIRISWNSPELKIIFGSFYIIMLFR